MYIDEKTNENPRLQMKKVTRSTYSASGASRSRKKDTPVHHKKVKDGNIKPIRKPKRNNVHYTHKKKVEPSPTKCKTVPKKNTDRSTNFRRTAPERSCQNTRNIDDEECRCYLKIFKGLFILAALCGVGYAFYYLLEYAILRG